MRYRSILTTYGTGLCLRGIIKLRSDVHVRAHNNILLCLCGYAYRNNLLDFNNSVHRDDGLRFYHHNIMKTVSSLVNVTVFFSFRSLTERYRIPRHAVTARRPHTTQSCVSQPTTFITVLRFTTAVENNIRMKKQADDKPDVFFFSSIRQTSTKSDVRSSGRYGNMINRFPRFNIQELYNNSVRTRD